MGMQSTALVTGTRGGIGSAIVKRLKQDGYSVCGIDLPGLPDRQEDWPLELDLLDFAKDLRQREETLRLVREWLGERTLDILVNNAAYQFVSKEHPLPVEEFDKSYGVNVLAPYYLIAGLAPNLTPRTASVVNIGSIHNHLTKPGFLVYAHTKAALASITRGLALDYGDRFRVNCIEPGAVNTAMLSDGFRGHDGEKKHNLESYNPQNRIATPEEIAELVLLISSSKVQFLHGSCIDISGALSCRLHDPL